MKKILSFALKVIVKQKNRTKELEGDYRIKRFLMACLFMLRGMIWEKEIKMQERGLLEWSFNERVLDLVFYLECRNNFLSHV